MLTSRIMISTITARTILWPVYISSKPIFMDNIIAICYWYDNETFYIGLVTSLFNTIGIA